MTLEIRGVTAGLLDDPLLLEVRGAAPGEELLWRARYRDDDLRVWRASAVRTEDLMVSWRPSKPSTGPLAALHSLRPVQIEVRVEAPDGRATGRRITRRLVGDGVRLRRWRDGLAATLHLPAGEAPCATVLVDGTGGPRGAAVSALAGPLLASRGVLVVAVASGTIAAARERLCAVPGAAADDEVEVLPALDPLAGAAEGVVLPPGVGVRQDDGAGAAAARAAAWDALLSRLGARPRSGSAQ